MKRFLGILLSLALFATLASAHLNSFSYSSIEIGETEINIELRFTLICTLELFNADPDGDMILTKKELDAIKPLMYYYLSNKIKILAGGRQLKFDLKKMYHETKEDESLVVMQLSYKSAKPIKSVIILCNVSEENDPFHRNIAEIKMKDKQYLFVFTADNYFNSDNPPKPQAAVSGVISPATR